jgi:hypothetical protein
MQTPVENIMPRPAPSLRLILAAVIFNKPGGITPISATKSPKKNTTVILKF